MRGALRCKQPPCVGHGVGAQPYTVSQRHTQKGRACERGERGRERRVRIRVHAPGQQKVRGGPGTHKSHARQTRARPTGRLRFGAAASYSSLGEAAPTRLSNEAVFGGRPGVPKPAWRPVSPQFSGSSGPPCGHAARMRLAGGEGGTGRSSAPPAWRSAYGRIGVSMLHMARGRFAGSECTSGAFQLCKMPSGTRERCGRVQAAQCVRQRL